MKNKEAQMEAWAKWEIAAERMTLELAPLAPAGRNARAI
jgi:hypothetical protein